MRIRRPRYAVLPLAALSTSIASAQLEIVFEFDPSQSGGLCSTAADAASVWVYDCNDSVFDSYDTTGAFLGSIPRSGGAGNDVDLDVVTAPMTLAGMPVPAGSLLHFDGEIGVCEVYALDPANGNVLASLVTSFGNSHVVGGAYCPVSDTLYLVQDSSAPVAERNQVAQVDPDSGAVLTNFFTDASGVSVNFGDIDVSTVSGNLYVVSSSEPTIAEFTPSGTLVAEYDLPTGVGSLSGIATDDLTGGAWVGSTSGVVWFLSSLVQIGQPYCAPAVANSSGAPALARAFGSEQRSVNRVRLAAFQLPAGSFGYFLTSRMQGFVMNPGGSQGNICLGGTVGRYNQPAQVFNSMNVGRATVDIDLGATPTPAMGFISIQAGETWHFQAWYRDANPGPTSNFTDAVSVAFT